MPRKPSRPLCPGVSHSWPLVAATDPRPSRPPFSLSLCPLCPSPPPPAASLHSVVLELFFLGPPIFLSCALCPRLGGAHPPGVSGGKQEVLGRHAQQEMGFASPVAAGSRAPARTPGIGPSSDAEHLTPLHRSRGR